MSESNGKARGFNNIRVQPYPSLEEGNGAFPKGQYEISHEAANGDHAMILKHKLHNARLIERMVSQSRAVFACAISAPRSAFRELLKSSQSSQTIAWNAENFGEQPYFTPMIVCTKETKISLNPDWDDVHENWRDTEITFPRGARLARASVMQCRSGIKSMLTIRVDDKLREGQFRVEPSGDNDFRFFVDCHPRLHAFLKAGKEIARINDILTHIVTACFVHLKKAEQDTEGYPELNALAKQLESKECLHWNDPDFCPELAATALYPHSIPVESDDDD